MTILWRAVDDDHASARSANVVADDACQVATREIVEGLSLEGALSAVIRSIARLFDATTVTAYLTGPDGLLLSECFTMGKIDGPHWETVDPNDPEPGLSADVIRRTEPLYGEAPVPPLTEWTTDQGTRATLALVPLQHEGRHHGMLHVSWSEGRTLTPLERELLITLASYSSVAIDNARLHEREVEAARLEGVRLAARTAADQVGNDLAVVMWMADLALRQLMRGEPVDPHFLEAIAKGASNGIQTMQRILDVEHVETLRSGQLPPILDLSRVEPA